MIIRKEMKKPEVGDVLFLVDTGNLIRNGKGKQRECIVSKVGRKYFYVDIDSWYEIQFYIENWCQKSNYIADYILYESKKEWEDACLIQKYREVIKDAFVIGRFGDNPAYNATLPQLKQIIEILGINTKE